MKTYIKFISYIYLKAFLNTFLIMMGLVLILNLLSELDFFKDIKVSSYFTLYLSFLNSFSLIFEMFPFIFLISTQLFFLNLFKNNELQVFKYSGLRNSSIIKIISFLTFSMGVLIIIIYYSLSSSFKNHYLNLKSNYTSDDKYLAVITNNGLWIKDKVGSKSLIVNSSKIDENYLIDTFISEFDEEFQIIRSIKSDKINITDNEWILNDAAVFINNSVTKERNLKITSNFNYKRIQSLYSNLSSLSINKLFELKKNYKLLGYSTVEVDLQIQKLTSFPLFFLLMTIFSSIIMYNSKNLKSSSIKISVGLFLSVIIYYLNNFFYVLGNTERISLYVSVWVPLFTFFIANLIMLRGINEK